MRLYLKLGGSKRSSKYNHLCVTSLHMSQCHFWIDGMTTRHTENLQVCVLAVTFIHLHREPKHFYQKVLPLFFFHQPSYKQRLPEIKTSKLALTLTRSAGMYHEKAVPTEQAVQLKERALTSSSCWTACCLALAMMPSSSWKRRSISVRRSRAFCWSRRMRSSCFLPCSSAMQGLCCHCWIR